MKMEINVIKKEKNELEFEIGGKEDTTLAEVIVFKLNTYSDVDFAAYKIEHPLVTAPRIYLRVKKGDPVKVMEKALDELKTEIADFREHITKIKA